MSDQARNLFIERITSRLSSFMTSKQVFDVMSIILEAISMYHLDIEQFEVKIADDYLEVFLSAKKLSGIMGTTLHNYRKHLQFLQNFAECPIQEITQENVKAYFDKERARGIRRSTMKSERRIFCSFFNWLKENNYLLTNPMDNFRIK